MAKIAKLSMPEEGKLPLCFDTRYPQSYAAQYKLLLKRNFVSYYRNSSYNCTRFSFGLILGLLFGSALWNIGQKRYKGTEAFMSKGHTIFASLAALHIDTQIASSPPLQSS